MRSLLVALVALVVVGCGSPSSPSADNGLSGTWTGTSTGQLVGSVRTTLAQNGSNLSGSWSVAYSNATSGSGTLTGSANGSSVSLALQPSVPTQCPIQLTATVSGSRMTGTAATFNCSVSSSGSIDLTKQ